MLNKDYLNTDLGENYIHLKNVCDRISNSIFVDLGVREGISSSIMLNDAETKNNKVFGIDVDFSPLLQEVSTNTRYTKLLGDSVSIGKHWNNGKVKVLFIDTFHIADQVLCELYYWFQHLENECYVIFHDSHWPQGKHDIYGEIKWPRVEEAIVKYFNLPELTNTTNEVFDVNCYPPSWGMTVIKIKDKNKFNSGPINWPEVFNNRNKLISLFWNEQNKENRIMDLILTP
jgi:hypothetical protein